MNAAHIAVMASVLVCAGITLLCCLALLLIKDVIGRMHYLAPVTSVSVGALLAGVVIQEGWSSATLKTVLVLFVLCLVNAVLTHATARAARIRQYGHWLPQPQEKIAGRSLNPGSSES